MSDSPPVELNRDALHQPQVLLVPIATIRSGETLSSDKAGVS
jgi:hypothetical protein